MGETLKNPPLIEVLCQFVFLPNHTFEWDWGWLDDYYNAVKDEFPEKTEVDRPDLRIPLEDSSGKEIGEHVSSRLIQLKRRDNNLVVQIGKNILVVNNVGIYPGWPAFRDKAIKFFSLYEKITRRGSLMNLGIRYINQWAGPANNFRIGDYFQQTPPLEWAPEGYLLSGFHQQYRMGLDEPEGVLLHISGLYPVGGAPSLRLDLDFHFGVVDHLRSYDGSLTTWLDGAHEHIYKAFVGTISPDLYTSMREGRKWQ